MKSVGGYSLGSSVKRVLLIQCSVALAVVVIVAGHDTVSLLNSGNQGSPSTTSFLVKLGSSVYGSALAIAGTILSARSIRRASDVAGDLGNAAMVPLFSGLLNKLVVVGGGIAVGLVVLDFEPIHLIAGYLVVQLSALWTLLRPG